MRPLPPGRPHQCPLCCCLQCWHASNRLQWPLLPPAYAASGAAAASCSSCHFDRGACDSHSATLLERSWHLTHSVTTVQQQDSAEVTSCRCPCPRWQRSQQPLSPAPAAAAAEAPSGRVLADLCTAGTWLSASPSDCCCRLCSQSSMLSLAVVASASGGGSGNTIGVCCVFCRRPVQQPSHRRRRVRWPRRQLQRLDLDLCVL